MERASRHTGDFAKVTAEKYSTMIYRIAYACTLHPEDSEDVMQEVFLRFLRRAPVFESPEHERAWFVRVAVNCAKSKAASPWRRRIVPLDAENFSAPDPSVRDVSLFEALAKLPPALRSCVHLYYFEELPVREIAKITGSSEPAVKSRLFRARKLLAKLLSDDGPQSPQTVE